MIMGFNGDTPGGDPGMQSASRIHVGAPADEEEDKSEEKKTKSKIALQPPTGVLAVHIKTVHFARSFKLQDRFSQSGIMTVYLRVWAGGHMRTSTAFELQHTPKYLSLDELRHLPIRVCNKKSDEDNKVRLELIAFQNPTLHYTLASCELHLFQLIKNLYASDTYTLIGRGKATADVDVEFCFSYGTFGYGYSNQLENRQKAPQDQLSHSLFCRLEPPAGRNHDEMAPDVMTCQPVGHPAFIPFTCKTEIGTTAKEFGTEDELEELREVVEPTLLISKMRKKIHHLQAEYSKQTSRRARLRYLNNVINNDNLKKTAGTQVFNVPKGFPLKKRKIKPTGYRINENVTMPEMAYGQEDTEQEETLITDLKHAADVMEMMPGVSRRRTSSIKPKFTQAELDKEEEVKIASQPRWLKKILATEAMQEPSDESSKESPTGEDLAKKMGLAKSGWGGRAQMRQLVKVLKEKSEATSDSEEGIQEEGAAASEDEEEVAHSQALAAAAVEAFKHAMPRRATGIFEEKIKMSTLGELDEEDEEIDNVPAMPSFPSSQSFDKQCKIEINISSTPSLDKDIPSSSSQEIRGEDHLGEEISDVKSLLKRRLTWKLPDFLQRRFSWRRPATDLSSPNIDAPIESGRSPNLDAPIDSSRSPNLDAPRDSGRSLAGSSSINLRTYNRAPRKSVFEMVSDKMHTILSGGLPHSAHKLVIPRVMVSPPTPDLSDNSEPEEDDDFYYDAQSGSDEF